MPLIVVREFETDTKVVTGSKDFKEYILTFFRLPRVWNQL
jgi:hypothetical protein